MKFSKSRIIRFIVMLVFLACALFANFYAVRKMMRYGLELYFYDKLLVAYNIGGRKGLEVEMEKIRTTDKMPRELALAKDFEIKLKELKDPAEFLSDKVTRNKNMVNLVRNLRSIAIILMLLIFSWRLIINLPRRSKR